MLKLAIVREGGERESSIKTKVKVRYYITQNGIKMNREKRT